MCAVKEGEIVGDVGTMLEPGNGSFRCHPECLKRSYWRKVLLEIEEEIRGLRPGQFVELVLAVEEAEKDSWWADRPATRIGRRSAVELFLRGWPEDRIDRAFGFPHGATVRVIAESKIHAKAREVVAAHLEGASPSKISRQVGIGIPTVGDILRSIGEEPHVVRDRSKSADVNRAVIRLYEEFRGRNAERIYQQIADRLGISVGDVRNRIAYARRKGRISTPPKPVRGRKRAAG